LTFTCLYGIAALIFLANVTYHVISKIRGNEKNVQMNNLCIALALLPLFYYAVYFSDDGTYTLISDKKPTWYNNHKTLYL